MCLKIRCQNDSLINFLYQKILAQFLINTIVVLYSIFSFADISHIILVTNPAYCS